jgi:hypothetical protein
MRKLCVYISLILIFSSKAISVETKYLQKIPDIHDKLLVCKVYYEFINENDSSNKAYAKIGAYVNELNKYKSFNITIKNTENIFKNLNTYFLDLPAIDSAKVQLNNKYKRTCDKLISKVGVSMPWDAFEAVINADNKFKDAIRSFDILADLEGVRYDFTKKTEKNELEEFFNSSDTNVSNKNSGDIKGKKLWCSWRGDENLGYGFEFNNNNKVKLKGIDDDNEKLITIKGEYQALSNKIIIKYKNLDNSDEEITINRKTLKIIGSSNSFCKPINKSRYIDNKLKFALDKLISEKSSENKF